MSKPALSAETVGKVLVFQEVGKSEPDTIVVSAEEYKDFINSYETDGMFQVKVDNEIRIYNLDFLSSIRIKEIE